MFDALTGPLRRTRDAVDVLHREIAKFGTVGLLAFFVDFGVFNLLRTDLAGGPLAHKPLTAKTISVAVAVVVAWLGNRYWTFRHRRRASRRREFVLFVVMNVAGLLISLGCLGLSHYVLKLDSALADNISGNVIGLGLGTLFRFWAYRRFVFVAEDADSPDDPDAPDDPDGEHPSIDVTDAVASAAPTAHGDIEQPIATRQLT